MQTSASAYERHQLILEIVNRNGNVRVVELADQLEVSETTIRTDLETLHERGSLVRVRGGAIANPTPDDATAPAVNLSAKARKNGEEKQRIARWAAGLVEDNDVIMLDASSTVLHIAQFLHDRRNLTVFTNGITVAQQLAREASNTVIVIGGILRPDGNAITGEISKHLLQDYHVRTAFVSSSAFTPDEGFFERDMREAQMKALMLKSAQRRVAMIDASKIGEVGLTSFATLADFDYFVTDEHIERSTIHRITSQGTQVIVCSARTNRTYKPNHGEDTTYTYRIGFANLSENTAFSRDVRRGLERAVEAHGQIELIVADNQLNPDVALTVADQLISQQVDMVIEYQIDEATGNLIAHNFQQAGIPVIAVDIPMVGGVYFGVNNYQAGKMAGVKLGSVIQRQWNGRVDAVIVMEQRRAGNLPAMRIQGQLDGLQEALPAVDLSDRVITVDSDNTSEQAYLAMQGVLKQIAPDARFAVICFNDDAAVGALYAAREAAMDRQMLLVGQGADRRLRNEMREANSPVVGATAYRPERYGEYLLQIALDILAGKQVPPALYMEHDFITPQNVDTFYPDER
ncbi:MAG: substrate-binding domain-containing protein [Chloroflexota bacterium]